MIVLSLVQAVGNALAHQHFDGGGSGVAHGITVRLAGRQFMGASPCLGRALEARADVAEAAVDTPTQGGDVQDDGQRQDQCDDREVEVHGDSMRSPRTNRIRQVGRNAASHSASLRTTWLS